MFSPADQSNSPIQLCQSSSIDELSGLARVAYVGLCLELASTHCRRGRLGDVGSSSDAEMLVLGLLELRFLDLPKT